MNSSKLCWKSYDDDGVVNSFFIEKGMPCPNLLKKLEGLGTLEKVTPDLLQELSSDKFWFVIVFILFNYFMIRKQLNPKPNDNTKDQESGNSTTKFKALGWIQRNDRNRIRAVVFSSWMIFFQISYGAPACTMVFILAYRQYLANGEWTKPCILSLILVAIRFLMFGLSVLSSLIVWVHVLKVQARYIRALIHLEFPPEQNTKEECSVPQELPVSAPLASPPPSSVPATNYQKPALQFPTPPIIRRPVVEKLAQTATSQQTGPKTPPESHWETASQRPQLESFDQKRAKKNIPKRHTPAPVFPLKAPAIDCTHPMTTARQPTSTTSQQGSQTTFPHLSYNSLTGNAPPSCTDSTTNRANDISVRDEAFNALFRQFKASAKSRQDQGAFNTTPASSPTGRVPVGQAFEENTWKRSGFPAQSGDWEHVYHEEGDSGSQ